MLVRRGVKSLAGQVLVFFILVTGIFQLASPPSMADDIWAAKRRVLFLGDSITYSGEYVAMVELALRLQNPHREVEILNLGLPSETVSGLSEPGHAGGNFPRPHWEERIRRVLEQTNPDLVVAGYGMNCGIYHPYSDARFDSYRQGIRALAQGVASIEARLILLTPPVFDELPIRDRTLPAGQGEFSQPYRDYDQVLILYSAWLVAAQAEGWVAIDTHTPLRNFLASQRQADPQFTLATDGVHLNEQGHWLIAREVIRTWVNSEVDVNANDWQGAFAMLANHSEVLAKIKRRQQILRDAWLTKTGHKRPGLPAGLQLDEAESQAAALDVEIREWLNISPQGTRGE